MVKEYKVDVVVAGAGGAGLAAAHAASKNGLSVLLLENFLKLVEILKFPLVFCSRHRRTKSFGIKTINKGSN